MNVKEALDTIVVAVDWREDEDPSRGLYLETDLQSRLHAAERGEQPVVAAEEPAGEEEPVAGGIHALGEAASRLQCLGRQDSYGSASFAFPAAACRSASRLAMEAVGLDRGERGQPRQRRVRVGVGIVRGYLDAASLQEGGTLSGAAVAAARRLAVLAPDDTILACPELAALLRAGGADACEVRPGVWQVLWIPSGGSRERRRACRLTVSTEARLRLPSGRSYGARTLNVSRTGVCLEVAAGGPVCASGDRVEVDLGALDPSVGRVEGRVVEVASAVAGGSLIRVGFEGLDEDATDALLRRLFCTTPRAAAAAAPVPMERSGPSPAKLEDLGRAAEALARAGSLEEVGKIMVTVASQIGGLVLPGFEVQVGADDDDDDDARVRVEIEQGEDRERVYVLRAARFTATLRGALSGPGPDDEADSCTRSLIRTAGATLSRLVRPAAAAPAPAPTRTGRDGTSERLLAAQLAAGIGPAYSMTVHSLNNTLTPLLALSQLLAERDDLPADVAGDLARMALYSEQMADELARLNAWQRRGLARSTVDLHRVILDVAALWRSRLDMTGIELACSLNAANVVVHGDPQHLGLLFHHLVDNAREAVRRTGRAGTIEIATRDEEDTLIVEVSDNGCGVPDELRGCLFDAYVSDAPVEGAGLGLALCRYLAKRLDGRLTLACSDAQGTVIRLQVPRVAAPPVREAREQVLVGRACASTGAKANE